MCLETIKPVLRGSKSDDCGMHQLFIYIETKCAVLFVGVVVLALIHRHDLVCLKWFVRQALMTLELKNAP